MTSFAVETWKRKTNLSLSFRSVYCSADGRRHTSINVWKDSQRIISSRQHTGTMSMHFHRNENKNTNSRRSQNRPSSAENETWTLPKKKKNNDFSMSLRQQTNGKPKMGSEWQQWLINYRVIVTQIMCVRQRRHIRVSRNDDTSHPKRTFSANSCVSHCARPVAFRLFRKSFHLTKNLSAYEVIVEAKRNRQNSPSLQMIHFTLSDLCSLAMPSSSNYRRFVWNF